MPCIVCSFCQYIGQGINYGDQLEDVIEHEETCIYAVRDKNE